jgi:hypothetical protein
LAVDLKVRFVVTLIIKHLFLFYLWMFIYFLNFENWRCANSLLYLFLNLRVLSYQFLLDYIIYFPLELLLFLWELNFPFGVQTIFWYFTSSLVIVRICLNMFVTIIQLVFIFLEFAIGHLEIWIIFNQAGIFIMIWGKLGDIVVICISSCSN